MHAVILVIHMILAAAIIGLVLLQRSEGGGLGIGSGGGMGGFASPQATANALTRVTWICVGCFFMTSLVLGVLAGHASSTKGSILDQLDKPAIPVTAPAESAPAPVPAPEPAAPVSE